jgi:selenoprotein W-related protein
LAAAIQKEHHVAATLIEGSGGNFDVKVDGKLIYSKKETGRFPEDNEVLSAIAQLKPVKK